MRSLTLDTQTPKPFCWKSSPFSLLPVRLPLHKNLPVTSLEAVTSQGDAPLLLLKLVHLHFNTISRWFVYILKFHKYWCRSMVLGLGCTLNHLRSFNNHCCLGPTGRDWFIGLEYSVITGILQTPQVLLTCNQVCSPFAEIPTPGKDLPSLPTTLLLALWLRPYQMLYSTLQDPTQLYLQQRNPSYSRR